ncbi:MAG: prepilin peptidase [Candidatus Levybacteria bacterium]|nr:prepilin peptidase [Candidatus Levybacteria bacterium]
MEWVLILIIGLSIGSFLNVLIFRLDKRGGILTGRSECPKCGKQLKWYDLFPVVSYVFLARKCRYCKTDISFVYPLVEFLTGLSFVAIYISFTNQTLSLTMGLFYVLIISVFISIILFDYLYFLIPDKIILPTITITILFNYFFRQPEFMTLLLSALTLSGIFAIMYLVSKGEWVGLGDAKLLFLIGLVLGYPLGFLSMIFSVWIAALVGIGLMISGRANRKTALPFGSFLAGISILIIIFQNEIQKIVQQFI